jgi:death on curing protein
VSEPLWLSTDLVLSIHDEQLRQFGGPPGLRDLGLPESALGRPLDKYAYGTEDLAALAAAYAFGLARNHAFVDGNKRIAFLATLTFLGLNDVELVVPEADAVVIMLALAAGEVDEDGFARWIRDNWPDGEGVPSR